MNFWVGVGASPRLFGPLAFSGFGGFGHRFSLQILLYIVDRWKRVKITERTGEPW